MTKKLKFESTSNDLLLKYVNHFGESANKKSIHGYQLRKFGFTLKEMLLDRGMILVL
jgi:hypothetical protein